MEEIVAALRTDTRSDVDDPTCPARARQPGMMTGLDVAALAIRPAPATSSIMPTDPNQNMAVSLALAGLAFVVTLIIGRPIVTFLRQHRIGKKVRDRRAGDPHRQDRARRRWAA